MNSVMLPQISGDKVTFICIYKNQFNNWNLKEQIVLTPQQIDGIYLGHITKFKIYNQTPIQNHYIIKLQQTTQQKQQKVHLYAVNIQSHRIFYQKILIYKLKLMELEFQTGQRFQDEIQDTIMKKSQFLGNWEQRFVRISKQEGLTSKKVQKQKQSLHIKQTKQIWTRFQLIQNKRFIVMKCKYLIGKQQFGIPAKNCAKWIKAFYTLFKSSEK